MKAHWELNWMMARWERRWIRSGDLACGGGGGSMVACHGATWSGGPMDRFDEMARSGDRGSKFGAMDAMVRSVDSVVLAVGFDGLHGFNRWAFPMLGLIEAWEA
jgi:hypothetical protein